MTHTRRYRAEGLVEGDPPHEGMDDSEAGHRSGLTDKRHWGALLAIFAGIGLLALVIVLHVTGVLGPGAH